MKIRKANFPIGLIVIALLVLLTRFGLGSDIKGVSDIRYGIDIRGGVEAIFQPVGSETAPTGAELEAARNVINSRLDNLNIVDREVTINEESSYIIVRFPWKSDEVDFNPEEAIAELGQMAVLTFQDSDGNVLLEGKHVTESYVGKNDNTGTYVVSLKFDSEGSAAFAQATEAMLGKQMGIYMDDVLISNPVVNTVITAGSAEITGMSSYEEAKDLSDKISAGALPFSMETSNYKTISPSLGATALKVMVMAGIVAFIFVCIFMLLYYRLSGLIACFALTSQMALSLMVISIPQITLTLPGIAGIILSLGMSLDCNIITAERISEELKKGLTIKSAIKKGYENSFSALLDGNVTTGVVAIILMIFGSGTMWSFGYTLLTGVLINFVAGIYISKFLLQSIVLFKPFNNVKLFKEKKEKKTIHFYEKRKYAFMLSSAMIVVGIVISLVKGISLDTQFAGGAILSYTYEGEINTDEISEVAADVVDRPVTVQIATDSATGEQNLVVTLAGNESITPKQQEALNVALTTKIGDSVALAESYIVEPYFGQVALNNSIVAIIVAAIFIIVYVWIRFSTMSISAGVSAVIALVHDMLFVLFTFALFGIPLNDAFVGVILTIIGYSCNDTIVLYDRIRENIAENKEKLGVGEIVSLSTTQVLGRSINTSFATVMCVFIVYGFSVAYGINSIEVFTLPMFMGLLSGCYSTIFIAAPIWASWKNRKKKIVEK